MSGAAPVMVPDRLDPGTGERWTATADDVAFFTAEMASGAVALDVAATVAKVGLPYTSSLQTMRLEAGALNGTAQGKIKRIDEVTVRLYRTVNALVGSNSTDVDRIAFRSAADAMDRPIPLFSGDKEIEMPSGYDQDAYVLVQQDLPLPMTIISIIARAQTYD